MWADTILCVECQSIGQHWAVPSRQATRIILYQRHTCSVTGPEAAHILLEPRRLRPASRMWWRGASLSRMCYGWTVTLTVPLPRIRSTRSVSWPSVHTTWKKKKKTGDTQLPVNLDFNIAWGCFSQDRTSLAIKCYATFQKWHKKKTIRQRKPEHIKCQSSYRLAQY